MKVRDAYRKIIGREAAEDLARLGKRVDRIGERSQSAAKDAELHVREMNRIAPQLAALEAKVEDLRQELTPPPGVDGPEDLVAARSLVQEIQREHAQIRIRLSAVTTYEERLRRIEEKLGLPHD